MHLRRAIAITTALLVALATLTFFPTRSEAALGPITIRINGEVVPTDVPPYIDNGRTMVPIRAISEGLGARVAWYEGTRQVYVRLGDNDMWLTIGSKTATLNDKKVTLDAAASIVSGRTMVPIRFISENIGCKVGWDNATRTVTIEKRNYEVTKIEWVRQNGQGRLFVFSEGITGQPKVTTVASPDRLIVDIPDVVIPANWPDQAVNDGNIIRIRAGMLQTNPNVARVVVDLVQPTEFKAYRTDRRDQVVVDMGYKASGVTVAAVTGAGAEQAVKLATTGPVTFKTMTLTGPDRVVVDVDRATLGKNLVQLVPQPDNNPLVSQVRIAQFSADPDVVRMVVDLKKPAAYGVAAADDGLTVYVAPQQAATAINYAKVGLNGRLTLTGTGPLTVTEKHQLPVKLIFDVAGLPAGPDVVSRPVFDGVVNQVIYSPMAGVPNTTRVTVELPYHIGHKGTLSTDGRTYTIDVTGSPLLGKVIVLDPGHGGDDPGSGGVSGAVDEKTINLDITLRLRDLLVKAGAKIHMTRETAGENPSLQRRVEFANSRNADIFLSIHNNSYLAREAGTETYWYNSAPGSKDLAGLIQASMVATLGRPNRGVKTASFTVIKDTYMAAVLVECLFMSNTTDEQMLRDPAVRQKIANALYSALSSFAGR